MDDEERYLDGNAVAGLLAEILPFETTMMEARCAVCGAMEPAGAELVFVDAPGMVMRCVHCRSVLIKIVHGGGRYWVDMRGIACLQITEP